MKKSNIFFTLILIILFSIFYSTVLHPSYLSYVSVCNPVKFQEDYSEDYYVQGNVQINESNEEPLTVTLNTQKNTVIRHETIHINQYKTNRLFSCQNPIEKFLNEAEAYTFQYLPDKIFYHIYTDYKIGEEK